MKNFSASILVTATLLIPFSTKAAVSMAKAAELALHRVERLKKKKKIDESFITRFESLTLKAIDPAQHAGASFATVVGQQGDVGTDALRVEIKQDGNGRALNFALLPGTAARSPVNWAAKDPLSLTETVLHHLTESGHGEIDLSAFDKGMTSLVIVPVVTATGTIAQATILSSETERKLMMSLEMDGTFISAVIE